MTEYMMKTDKNGKPRYYKSVDGKMKVISRSRRNLGFSPDWIAMMPSTII